METLADLGVPYEEAHAYAEGVHRGGALHRDFTRADTELAERSTNAREERHPVGSSHRCGSLAIIG